jgi:hypothetical protein
MLELSELFACSSKFGLESALWKGVPAVVLALLGPVNFEDKHDMHF